MSGPFIGITSRELNGGETSVQSVNFKRIVKAGGVPIIVPNTYDQEMIEAYAHLLHGLLLTGGPDIDPLLFDEEPIRDLGQITPRRDFLELEITKLFYEKQKPILGICRGLQVLNVAQGGTLYQDIYAQYDGKLLKHRQNAPSNYGTHFINIDKQSELYKIVEQEKIRVNSYHHQAIKDVGQEFYVSSRSSDGIIESIESNAHPFAIGVQWHPEHLEDAPSDTLFAAFVKATRETA